MQAPRQSTKRWPECSPRKDCPYSYALLLWHFPLAKPRLNGGQGHFILSYEGSHHLNLLSVCHTIASSSPHATFCFTVRLMLSRCVSRGIGYPSTIPHMVAQHFQKAQRCP